MIKRLSLTNLRCVVLAAFCGLKLTAQYLPGDVGTHVNGFQDDFNSAPLDPDWLVVGGDVFSVDNGLLHATFSAGDPNHLLYTRPGYDSTVQEVLIRIRITDFGTGDWPRCGAGVGVDPGSSQGINYLFRDTFGEGESGRHVAFLDDLRSWGPGQGFIWENGVWYWMRLRQEPDAASQDGTSDVFGKIWPGDGSAPEPPDWQLAWDYTSFNSPRTGYAGIAASSSQGLAEFDVDYILIKAAGLPDILVAPNAFVQSPASITNQPVGQTVQELSPVTFQVGASGNPVPTYQWLRNGTPIPGATNASYTIPVTPLSDDQAGFRAVVANVTSNGTHSVTSDVATLTVIPDTTPPTVAQVIPRAGAVVSSLRQIEVHFSEAVKGVSADDLLVNGATATNVDLYAPDVYVFGFPQPATGPVQVTWSPANDITDLSAASNRAAAWAATYTLDPAAIGSEVFITEFMAGNTRTLRDEDGHHSDWLELYNAGIDPVDLGGWYLTDDPTQLTKWAFPPGVTLLSRSYLLLWASGNDRTNAAAPLHTNFKLTQAASGYLALVYSDGTTIVSSFAGYPPQYDDVSYGRDRLDPSLTGYFTNATPGAANATVGAGFAPEVRFSVPSGTFRQPFTLALSADDPSVIIRYVLVTNGTTAALTGLPNSSSPVYAGPITVSGSMQVRARAFPTLASYFPGPPHGEVYFQLAPDVANFSSDLPIVVFHDLGGGPVAATTDQFMTMAVFDNTYGRSALTNTPDLAVQGSFHRRGQATFWNPKPNLRVETHDAFGDPLDVPVAGLPAENDWVFYAIDQYDKALMHNPLIHELYRELGHYTSRTRFVEVYLKVDSGTAGPITQADYYGLYVLEEKIKIGRNRVDIDKLQPENLTAPSVTGGYLLSIDKSNPGNPAYLADASMWYLDPDYFEITGPARASQQQYIDDYFTAFYAALTGPNWTDPVNGYAPYIDLDSWIDYHLHQTLVFNVDALRISAFFYKPRNGPIVQGPLWDFDRCFGTRTPDDARGFNPRQWRSAEMDGGTDMFNPGNTFNNPWYGLLFTDADFWQRWIDRYQELRRTAYSLTNLFARIDFFGDQVREATTREYPRWAGSGSSDTSPREGQVDGDGTSYVFPTPGTWQGEIDFTKWWFSNRVDFMDDNFLQPPRFSIAGGPVASGSSLALTAATVEPNSTIYFTLDGSDPRLPGGAVSPAARASLNTATVTLTNNARVFARNFNAAHQNLTGPNNPPISSSWSGPTVGTFVVATPPLRVTELMFHPPPPPPGNTNDAENFEFVEFQNVSTAPINLQGYHLHGGVDFTFTSYVLGAGEYVVVVRNLAALRSRYPGVANVAGVYANNLGNGGDHLGLDGPLREPILDFSYQRGWQPAADGLGFSLVIRDPRAATGTWVLASSWRPSTRVNGSPGSADPPPDGLPPVLVSEALTHTDLPEVDTVELFNPTAAWVAIGGWWLTDDPATPKKYRISAGAQIPPGGCVTLSTNQFGSGPNGFSLSSVGDQVYLFSGDAGSNLTGYAHGFSFGPAPNGVSFGRYVNSQGLEQFVLQSRNTLGTNNAYPRVGPVVISEIMYHPPDLPGGVNNTLDEFLELENIAATNVPLFDVHAPTNTWRLRNAVDFDFPMNVVLTPGEHVLVVGFDPLLHRTRLNEFMIRYRVPANVVILGPWSGHLNNGGNRIELRRPDNPNVTPTNVFIPYYLVEEVEYDRVTPWATNADGGGWSLQRIDSSLFGNDPVNWQAAGPTAGQPNPPGPEPDVDGDGMPDAWELAHGLDPQVNDANLDPDADGMTNLQEYLAGTDPQDPTSVLRIEAVDMVDATSLVFRFTATPGRDYSVQWQAGVDGAWQKAADVAAGSVARAVWLTNTTDSGTTRFYRVVTPRTP